MTTDRLALLSQLFDDIATEFEPDFDGATMPEILISGIRQVIRDRTRTLPDLAAQQKLSRCLRHLEEAEAYFRMSLV